MYCRRCKYDLHGSTGPACPECGRAFDPDDPRTWEPIPSKPKTSLGILAVAFVILVLAQLVLGVLRPLLPGVVVRVDWLLATLAPVGAFVSGWYGDKRAARLLYGGLASLMVVVAFNTNSAGLTWVAGASVATQSTVWIGTALAMMFGSWLAGSVAWTMHIRKHRATAGGQSRAWPRPRTVVLVVVIGTAITLGWTANEVRKALGAVATLSVDYPGRVHALLVEAADVRAAEAADAWDELIEAIAETRSLFRELARRHRDARGNFSFFDVGRGDTLPADTARYRDAVETLRAAGLFDALARQFEEPMPIAPSPSWTGLWPAYTLASARAASMRFAVESGRFDDAAQGLEEIMATGRTFSYQGSSGAYGVGARLQRTGLAELRHELMQHPFPEPVCDRLLAAIERWPLAGGDLALECERLDLHSRIQRFFTDDGRGDGYRIAGGAAPLSIDRVRDAFARRFMLPTRREELALTDEAIDAALADLSVPLHQSAAAARDLPKEMADRHAVAARAVRTAASVLEEAARHRTEVATTRLALALSIFRARHGRWPDRLDDLVPRVLNGVPSDPMTGAPFGYRHLEDDPHGRAYEIYSFGPDGVDNGGNYDFRPPHERRRDPEGFDELLTPPRPPAR